MINTQLDMIISQWSGQPDTGKSRGKGEFIGDIVQAWAEATNLSTLSLRGLTRWIKHHNNTF
jgi:hypothetical protein